MTNLTITSVFSGRPQLRFHGFSDNWKASKLVELSENGFSNGVFNDPRKVGSGYKLINVKDMYLGDRIDITKLTLVELSKIVFEKNKANKGDIFFTRSSLVKEGIAYSNVLTISDPSITFDGHIIRMHPDPEKVDYEFLAKVLKTHKLRRQLVARGKTGTMTTIGQEDISTVKVSFPSLLEQRKITHFHSSIDSYIDNLKTQKSSLESYKKSIMQKIFSQEIRFKDKNGKNFPEWKEEKLSSITSIKTGKKDVNAGNLIGKYRFYTCAREYTFSDSFSFEGEAVLIAGNAEVGMCQYYYGKFEAYQRTYVLQNFKISGQYLFRYLSQYFHSYALGLKQSGAMSFIKLGMLNDFIVPIPTQVEQYKIADFLTLIDKDIESKQNQISGAELWKKGLMQRMFV